MVRTADAASQLVRTADSAGNLARSRGAILIVYLGPAYQLTSRVRGSYPLTDRI